MINERKEEVDRLSIQGVPKKWYLWIIFDMDRTPKILGPILGPQNVGSHFFFIAYPVYRAVERGDDSNTLKVSCVCICVYV